MLSQAKINIVKYVTDIKTNFKMTSEHTAEVITEVDYLFIVDILFVITIFNFFNLCVL